MKNKLMRKMKKTFKKSKDKGMILFEMADDFMDIIQNAKSYKKINKKRKKLR
ncbi:hypothetical protein R0131_18150 [Clostridium sp. AL.422]|uniref:hypothetical protein n=1 Tax=Clostridium TaxID=1485 RepID=UPI00293DFFB8|nr:MULTISPECIES: hypothetical protein [unclassified Clostridium]MDV4152755.1 hypothetical protein [Clostridium sp. AL.422]